MRAALFGWIMPLPAALLYSLQVPDAAGLPFVPRLDGPVEALGEVAKAGPDALVVGATLDALLVAFRWCGHAGSDLILT